MLSAIVLAAGLSKRMNGMNKLLLPYKNKTVIATVVQNILDGGIEEVIVVTGHEEDKIKHALKDFPVHFTYNHDYTKGITTSIQQGIMHATGDGYMICLSDMVLITPKEYATLKDAFTKHLELNKKCICMPVYKNEKGNPVIFSSFYKEAILKHEDMEGCKNIVLQNKENIDRVDIDTDHILTDMDSQDDYKKLNK